MTEAMLTPELRRALAAQGGRPLRLVDPDTNKAYLLVAEVSVDQLYSNGSADEAGAGSAEPFPAVRTPEWGRMNQRRAELIRKKVRGELTEAERQQYEWLQRKSLKALDAAHPRTGG